MEALESIMSSRALIFPQGTVTHLPSSDLETHEELIALARLEDAGMPLGVVVLPAAIEESFYRLNNLPPRLARLYQGLDPVDPDEDILEEAEDAADRLLAESYLLDDLIDAIYASVQGLPSAVTVRRAGSAGVTATGARGALLAVKRCYRTDWTATAVLRRLRTGGRLGVDARPVLVHAEAHGAGEAVNRSASTVLARQVHIAIDALEAITGVEAVRE